MGASGSILIVDDDPVVRQLITTSLESQGHRVTWEETGAAALSQAILRPPDLILLDVILPDIDGIEVCRCVRAEPRLSEVPVIMITALHDPDARLQSLEAGADDFITKPVDLIELRARAASILRLNRYRRLLEERIQRQRAEEEIVRRNRELLLLNAFITATAARLGTAHLIEEALRDACQVLVEALSLAEARAWLRLGPQASLITASIRADRAEHMAALDAGPGNEPRVTVPLAINGGVSGAISVTTWDGHALAEPEQAFVQSLAGALTQALESALLDQQLQRQVDTLEEKVAERTHELQTERDRTQAILEALGEAVIVTDADWLISYVNPATVALTGYDGSDLIGRSWSAMQPEGSTAALYEIIREHTGAGNTWRGEVSGRRRDGSTYDAAMTVAPIFDPRDTARPRGLVSILRNITPLKEAERLKDHFISNVSHELRTPLSIIALHSGNLDTLYDRLDDERRRQLIREVRAQADLLDDLIGDVLELSHIDSGRLRTEPRQLDLVELLRQEAMLLQPLAARKGVSLEVQATEGLVVHGDEAHLRQCIRNLISNAVKFTPAGGSVRCECRLMDQDMPNQSEWPASLTIESGSWAGLRVVDTGIGIAAQHQAHLFERFYRVHNQTRVPGTGLGLAITRELISRYGGWTGVASSPGAGSIFVFYLPIAR